MSLEELALGLEVVGLLLFLVLVGLFLAELLFQELFEVFGCAGRLDWDVVEAAARVLLLEIFFVFLFLPGLELLLLVLLLGGLAGVVLVIVFVGPVVFRLVVAGLVLRG